MNTACIFNVKWARCNLIKSEQQLKLITLYSTRCDLCSQPMHICTFSLNVRSAPHVIAKTDSVATPAFNQLWRKAELFRCCALNQKCWRVHYLNSAKLTSKIVHLFETRRHVSTIRVRLLQWLKPVFQVPTFKLSAPNVTNNYRSEFSMVSANILSPTNNLWRNFASSSWNDCWIFHCLGPHSSKHF